MSFKSMSYEIPKSKNTYTSEHEENNWRMVPSNQPILSVGCGAFSETLFGFYHYGGGTVTRVSYNAYPVRGSDTFSVMLRKFENGMLSDLEQVTFTGTMGSIQLNHQLTSNDTQIMVSHMSNSFQAGVVRVRFYIEVTNL